jgi:hypothetical protein
VFRGGDSTTLQNRTRGKGSSVWLLKLADKARLGTRPCVRTSFKLTVLASNCCLVRRRLTRLSLRRLETGGLPEVYRQLFMCQLPALVLGLCPEGLMKVEEGKKKNDRGED